MTFFYQYMRPLVEEGHLYAACPPLYKVSRKKGKGEEVHYFYSDAELAAFDTEGYSVTRYKGLGEMQPEQLWETTMNPENARMIQITIEDAEEAMKTVNVCMSDEVGPRREFILSRLGT